jgi:hypothetical protein
LPTSLPHTVAGRKLFSVNLSLIMTSAAQGKLSHMDIITHKYPITNLTRPSCSGRIPKLFHAQIVKSSMAIAPACHTKKHSMPSVDSDNVIFDGRGSRAIDCACDRPEMLKARKMKAYERKVLLRRICKASRRVLEIVVRGFMNRQPAIV